MKTYVGKGYGPLMAGEKLLLCLRSRDGMIGYAIDPRH